MRYLCCDERRRETIRNRKPPVANGIDFLEVVDSEAPAGARQLLLHVHFIVQPTGDLKSISAAKVRITGGVRVTGIKVDTAGFVGDVLEVRVDRRGDYSTYTLAIAELDGGPLPGLDPELAAVDFSFKVECPTDFDCRADCTCPPDDEAAPEIDYLARDYASFRRLMLDRLAAIVPDWQERNPADIGVALVEVLAYAADHLSYQLDAASMEATLATARRRTSATRHARLVDYRVSHGTNARAWVQVRVAGGVIDHELPAGTPLLTGVPGVVGAPIVPNSPDHRRAIASGATIFETMEPATLDGSCNELDFYTWGNGECCLPAGATRATLCGTLRPEPKPGEDPGPPTGRALAAGQVLIFKERVGPRTGSTADADRSHRHAVRLTRVQAGYDPIGNLFADPAAANPGLDVIEIAWAEEDALPFPLCLSAISDQGEELTRVSIALGNIVAADHGWTIDSPERLPVVPMPDKSLALAPAGAACHCQHDDAVPAPPRYRPFLAQGPLTMAAANSCAKIEPPSDKYRPQFCRRGKPGAAARLFAEPRLERAAICIRETRDDRLWEPRADLLGSTAFSREFVVEPETDGRAWLRFGDDEYGMRPAAGTELEALYRIGNGTAGNTGADTIKHIVYSGAPIDDVANPLPARGGTDPETIEHVRQIAPSAFRVPLRAVTADDYAAVAARHPQVQQAVASERWTGSWYTVFLTIDRRGGRTVDADFERELRGFLERFRMAGHDLEIDGPRFVPLEIELRVCVLPHFYRGDVKQALLARFTRGLRPDGQPGVFHPDKFSFAQPVYLSRIVAEAQETPGVRYVEALVFQRLGDTRSNALATGVLPIGRLEIAQLDNDPNFPERGVLRLTMEGGQ